MTATHIIYSIGFVVVFVTQIVSHFSHSKKVQDVASKVESLAQTVEANAPAIAQAVVATGLVTEVKQVT